MCSVAFGRLRNLVCLKNSTVKFCLSFLVEISKGHNAILQLSSISSFAKSTSEYVGLPGELLIFISFIDLNANDILLGTSSAIGEQTAYCKEVLKRTLQFIED